MVEFFFRGSTLDSHLVLFQSGTRQQKKHVMQTANLSRLILGMVFVTLIVAGMRQPVRGKVVYGDTSDIWNNQVSVIHTLRIGDTLYFNMVVAHASTSDLCDDGGIAK